MSGLRRDAAMEGPDAPYRRYIRMAIEVMGRDGMDMFLEWMRVEAEADGHDPEIIDEIVADVRREMEV